MKLEAFEIILIAIVVFVIALWAIVIICDVCLSSEDKIFRSDEFLEYLGISNDYIISIQTYKDVGGVDIVEYNLLSGTTVRAAYVMLETRVMEVKLTEIDGVYTGYNNNPVFIYYGGHVSLYNPTGTIKYTFIGLRS
ncbi:MAG: hypothetical protein PHG77_12690 [Proteiniphilum sp.]|nr:hypothetical protein [Proteiniphilum sp.]